MVFPDNFDLFHTFEEGIRAQSKHAAQASEAHATPFQHGGGVNELALAFQQ
jgi:hypothetical protein